MVYHIGISFLQCFADSPYRMYQSGYFLLQPYIRWGQPGPMTEHLRHDSELLTGTFTWFSPNSAYITKRLVSLVIVFLWFGTDPFIQIFFMITSPTPGRRGCRANEVRLNDVGKCAGVMFCMRPANGRRWSLNSNLLWAHTKWSLNVSGASGSTDNVTATKPGTNCFRNQYNQMIFLWTVESIGTRIYYE